MTRLLLVSDSPSFGGAEMAMLAVAEALANKTQDVSIAIAGDQAPQRRFIERAQRAGVKIVETGSRISGGHHALLSPLARRAAARRAADLLDQATPEAVVVNLATVERGAAIVDAARRAPTVRILAGYVHLGHRPSALGARGGWLRDRLAARHIARFDMLLAVSQSTAHTLHEITRSRIITVYPASPAVRRQVWPSRQEARGQLGLGPGPMIGVVGRVNFDHKGQDVTVRVAERLRRAGAAAEWVIVGDGPDLPRLRAMVQQTESAEMVHFLGWRSDILGILPAFDVLALPSRYEGLPLTAVEAMSARVPVVGYGVDGLLELLPPPFAVPFGDEVAFGDAITSVLHDPLLWPAELCAATAARLCAPEVVADRMLAALGFQGAHR